MLILKNVKTRSKRTRATTAILTGASKPLAGGSARAANMTENQNQLHDYDR